MKKIILSAIVACAAVFAQAELANWGLQSALIYDATGQTEKENLVASGTPVYVFDGAFITQQDVFDAWSQGKDLGLLEGLVAKTALSTGGGSVAKNAQFQYGTMGAQDKITFFWALPDSDSKVYISVLREQQPMASTMLGTLMFGSQNDGKNTFSSEAPTGKGFVGGGRWSSVPEPTSALLMLLGMAGLAIRRRRA